MHYRDPRDTSPLSLHSWAKWVRALESEHGVYVIRSKADGEILYVGESHSGQLYATITRHFQSWTGYSAGTRYSRGSVEVAAETAATGEEAIRRQAELIRSLKPRDNTHHVPESDEETDASEFQD